ncbi:hypothetical protein GGI05_002055 [Coemansia sp. RSA 2603]|nr:hypothetical protein GGI05_002055 [Coemansia sp. RSA 2603]
MTKPESGVSAGRNSNSTRDDSGKNTGAEATPTRHTYAHTGYPERENGQEYTAGGGDGNSGYFPHPNYERTDIQQQQHNSCYLPHYYTNADSEEDDSEAMGGMTATAMQSRSLPSYAPPVSTLELIPNAPRLDPQSLPPQDEFLSKFNAQLRTYRLVIVQQPIRARMCGSSDKDWRPVSPPPVLKLELYDMDGNPVIESSFMQFLVIHTTLFKDDREEELTVVELPHNASSKRISAAAKSRKRGVTQFGYRAAEPGLEMENNLLGDYAASSSIVEDERGERGCFFVFPNLSIRLEGRYRLRFMLIKLPSMCDAQHPMFPQCISTVDSEPFDVFSIKTFPGMIESTALSRALAQQGLKIPIRNTQENN